MTIAQNLETINATIHKTATNHGIDTNAINLIAVSKKQPSEKIQDILTTTPQRLFGENRVQEAQTRWAHHKDQTDIKLHLIGPLQTNKAKDAIKLFDSIHTLDREKLALKLAEEMKKQNRDLPCFIQINTGDETQKSGITPNTLQNFLEFCQQKCALTITGLMCIPPINEPPALHFALLKKLAQHHNLKNLSMGMSSDFEKAIPLTIPGGKTYIRIGTALFGAR